jgi:transcriptional regulator GlxA family with amidase domain
VLSANFARPPLRHVDLRLQSFQCVLSPIDSLGADRQRWAASNPADDLSVPALARRMGVTPRHFARLFRAEIGITPAVWVESIRIEAARRLLEDDNEPPKQVAAHCGFADSDTLRRAFQRQMGVTPAEYRKHHRTGL